MISLINASKTFNTGTANQLLALNKIELKIPINEFLVVIGANGSGKSTLLNALAGSIGLDEGELFIDTINVTDWKDYERSKFISRVFQNPLSGTAPDLSIIDNFRLAALRTQSKKMTRGIDSNFREKVKHKIHFLEMGLETKLDQKMGLLSGGQRQALTLMMAVMDDTKLLLLDEPTAALDPKSSQLVIEKTQQIISEYKLTAMLVTHEIKFAKRYGTRLIQMEEGKIIRDLKENEKKETSALQIFEWFN